MSVLPVGFGSAAAGGGFNVERSLRFNSADSANLTRTPTTTGSRRIYTHSAWFKRTGLSSAGFNVLWASESSGTNYVGFVYYQDKFYWNFYNGTTSYVVETTQVFRDVSAWSHIVVAVDTTQATASNRVRIYHNGVQITVFNTSNYPPQDQDLPINTSSFVHKIGFSAGFSQYLNGYMTEVNFLDGYPTVGGTTYNATTWAALNVSTLFGETDTSTGVWKPKAYTGTYGTNGFYLPFKTASQWSGYFDGTGDSLTYTSTVAIGSGDFTLEAWVYLTATPSVNGWVYGARSGSNTSGYLFFDSSRRPCFQGDTTAFLTSSTAVTLNTWNHIAVVRQGTATGNLKLYLNGTQVASVGTTNNFSYTGTQYIGATNGASPYNITGYISNLRIVPGTAVYTSAFTPPTSQLTAVSGTSLLTCQSNTFVDNSTNAFAITANGDSRPQQFSPFTLDVTDDHSGQGNHWQPNNLDLRTTGAGADILVDSPTAYGTDTGVGGEVRGNYCTWNRLQTSSSITLNNGNLDGTISGGFLIYSCAGTIEVTTSKWYYETVVTAGHSTAYPIVGVCDLSQVTSGINTSFYSSTGSGDTTGIIAHATGTNVYLSNNTSTTDGVSYNKTTDVLMIAFDADLGKVWFGKNGTWNNSSNPATNTGGHTFSTVSGKGYRPYVQCNADTSNSWTSNFGQRAFAYTAPSGFKALCTQNLPPVTIGATSTTQADKYFNVKLYSGNGNTGQTITGVGFQPDFTWLKNRNQGGGYFHLLYDAVRGAGYNLRSDSTAAETNRTAVFSAFTSDGFTFPAGQGNTIENDSVGTYASWNWNAGGSNQTISVGQYATSPANVPSIASTVRANTTSGFSIVSFAFPAVASKTVGHGLGVAPSMVIVKSRSNGTQQWITYHASSGNTGFLCLNKTDGFATNSTVWDNTSPTSTVFTLGSGFTSGNFGADGIAYCFADVDGYSKAFSYASNNSTDNAFVYLGFRPRWIMIKSSTTGGTNFDWVIYDTARMTYNYIANTDLRANLTITEGGTARNPAIDILSNGFKVRSSAGEIGSSTLYVGMAFAETPFKYALAR